MAAEIGPGTWVECIRAGDPLNELVLGSIYQVENICRKLHDNGDDGILIVGRKAKKLGICRCFHPDRFRPIFSDPEAVTRSILECIPVQRPSKMPATV